MNVKKLTDASLTLFNQYGESYLAGGVSTYIRTNNKLKMRWTALDKMENNSPFTHAMLHEGKNVLNVSAIVPFQPGSEAREIELEFAV